MLEVSEVVSGYGPVHILRGVCLRADPGEIISIVGPNGAGKSTLMRTIFGLIAPRQGRIVYQGRDITRRRPDQLVGLGLSYVPQEKNVFSSLTVAENMEMGCFCRRGSFGRNLESVFRIFPFLKNFKGTKAGSLSGGEQQMVAIGRALMLEPKVLLLDEPSAGLAPLLVAEIFSQIRRINREGVTVVMVEQNVKKALEISHRGYVLAMGRTVLSDSGANLLLNEEVGRLYLGD